MTADVRHLRIGDRVFSIYQPSLIGTVTSVDGKHLRVSWDDIWLEDRLTIFLVKRVS